MILSQWVLGADSKSRPGFNEGIHLLRGLAALMVVFFHAGGSVAHDKYQGFKPIADYTGGLAIGVDLFFVISGFVISLPLFIGKTLHIPSFLRNRALRIYPLTMLTAAIVLSVNFFLFSREANTAQLISSFLLVPTPQDPVPIVLWTLQQEVLFYALFVTAIYSPKVGLPLLLLWGLASLFITSEHFFLAWFFHTQNIQFLVGIGAAWATTKIDLNPSLATGMAVFAGGVLLVAGRLNSWGEYPEYMSAIVLGLAAGVTVFGAAKARAKIPAVFYFLGTASFALYLIHFFFISAIQKTLMAVVPWMPGLAHFVVLAVAATLLGCAYHVLFERPLERLRKQGGR